jgi:predicted ATPase
LGGDFPHGAWLVELAPVGDGEGRGPDPTAPRYTRASTVDALVAHLAGRSLLAVLDNCEHVIADAAVVTDALLRAVPGLRVLATSREALGVPGESLVPVGPLPIDDAVALLVDRAQAEAPAAQVAANDLAAGELCRRLDGMPLAIERAAARLRALPLTRLTSRLAPCLRKVHDQRQSTLRRRPTLAGGSRRRLGAAGRFADRGACACRRRRLSAARAVARSGRAWVPHPTPTA